MSDETTIAAAKTEGNAGPFAGVPGVGDVLDGKYEVEEILGAGGMGVVVAARHLNLGERVAIKFLLPKVAKDKETVERFMREARASARIKNEHVVRVMDAGRTDAGAPYIMMEYLEGTDLANKLRSEGPFAVHDAVDCVLQACEAIAEAHALGIVHRDLKPSNLFLTRRSDDTPCIKVVDFGISKALADEDGQDASLTNTQAVFGSPAYMSPEQIRSAKRVDRRTDVWALGVILYELLTDSLPFTGEHSAALLAAIAADTPQLMRERRPEISEGLDFVVSRCLEKDPARRIQSIPELARALQPHARPGSQSSVDRIQRLAASKGSARPSESNELRGSPRNAPDTVQSWGGPRSTRARAPRATMAAGLLAVLGVSALGAVIYLRGAARSSAPPASVSRAESTSSASASPSSTTIPSAIALPTSAPSASTAPLVRSEPSAGGARTATKPVQLTQRPRPSASSPPANADPPAPPNGLGYDTERK